VNWLSDPANGQVVGFAGRRGGALVIDGCDVQELAEQFGTPLYVISEAALRRRVAELRGAFDAAWACGEVVLMPAVKANYGLAVQRVLAQEGCGSDLFGGGELEVAIRAGTDPGLISVNGPCKDLATITRAVAMGARITLDDVHEIDLVRRAADQVGRRAVVRVRVKPDLRVETISDVYGITIGEAFGRYKPGIPWEDLVAAKDQLGSPELDLTGVMMHLGRHTTDLTAIGQVARRYGALIKDLSRAWDGWTPSTIDVGGGIAAQGDPHGKARREAHPAAPPGLPAYATAICGNLAESLWDNGIDPAGRRLEVEPGRALFGPCGVHLSRVLNVKRQTVPFPFTWVETDTSQAFLPDVVLEEARYPIALAQIPTTQPAADRAEVDVVGRSCTSDVLARGELLPAVGPSTLLAFFHTGAYQEAGAHNFNALSRPATVLVSGTDAHLVRRAETIDDVLARDVVPAHLQGELR
jgi:diaminopimelate decarboxylase